MWVNVSVQGGWRLWVAARTLKSDPSSGIFSTFNPTGSEKPISTITRTSISVKRITSASTLAPHN